MRARIAICLLWLSLSWTGVSAQTLESTSRPSDSPPSIATTSSLPVLETVGVGNPWLLAGWHPTSDLAHLNCAQAPLGQTRPMREVPGGGLSLADFSVHGEFTREHMMKMARNFMPSDPLPDAPSYTPMTSREKFEGWARHTYSVDMFFGVAVDSLILQATGGYRDYGGGMQGYAKRYGTTLLSAEATSLFGRWLFPTILHQDPRYFPSGQTNVFDRMAYAASRTIITRSDSGRDVFNSSLLLTLLVSSSLANGYKPNYERSFPATMANTFAGLGSVAQVNLLNEFWPDLKSMFTKQPPAQYVQKKLNDLAIKKKKD